MFRAKIWSKQHTFVDSDNGSSGCLLATYMHIDGRFKSSDCEETETTITEPIVSLTTC